MNVDTSSDTISLQRILFRLEEIDKRLNVLEREVYHQNSRFEPRSSQNVVPDKNSFYPPSTKDVTMRHCGINNHRPPNSMDIG